MRMPIAQYLRDCGYKVIEAASGDEAMAVLLHREAVVDVVFSDIEMPGAVDGFGLAKWIREHRPGLDVVLAGTIPRTVECAKELCEEGSVPKPYEAKAVHNHDSPLLNSPDGDLIYPGEPTNLYSTHSRFWVGAGVRGAVWLNRARANTNNTAGAATKR